MNARNARLGSRMSNAKWLLSFRGAIICSTLTCLTTLASGGCGASSQTARSIGGETHFLTRCSITCGDGLQCIAGVCTRPCTVGDSAACEELQDAECRADVELGTSAVCDVICQSDEECRALSSSHRCVGTVCRAPEAIGTDSAAEFAAGIGESSAGSDTSCADFRDRVGEAETVVMVRNALTVPIYLQPLRNCGRSTPRLVAFDRPVLFPDARETCGVLWCQEIQDSGYTAPLCATDCFSPNLVRLDPGAEAEVGQFRSEERAHGSTASGLPRMPDTCFSGRDPQLIPGVECSSEVPMEGSYVVTAQALTALECSADDEICNCVSNADGSCVTGVSSGSGEVQASEVFEAGTVRVDIVFR